MFMILCSEFYGMFNGALPEGQKFATLKHHRSTFPVKHADVIQF